MSLVRFTTNLANSFTGVSMGELVNATKTLARGICMDVQRQSVRARRYAGPSLDDEAEHGGWERSVSARRYDEAESAADARDFLAWALPQLNDDRRRVLELTLHGAELGEIVPGAPDHPRQRLPAPFPRPQGPREAQGVLRRMSTYDQVLSDFMDAWNAGRRPRVREYLARLPDGPEREELADQITDWLEVAPTPEYDADTRASIAREPVVRPRPRLRRMPGSGRPSSPRCESAPG